TAVRGFAPWLDKQSWWPGWLKLSPEPDQAFIWSLGQFPLQAYLAVPVTNSGAALSQVGQNLATHTNWEKHLLAPFALGRTDDRIFLRDVPFAGPEVRALKESSGDFLFADIFPNTPRGNPPPELLHALSRDNLVFYHWEVTSERLKELP
ncbi:MAG: hypothetical protein ACRED1_05140, partial [Limisphaerales bacterium]